jgi:hypothetical protein
VDNLEATGEPSPAELAAMADDEFCPQCRALFDPYVQTITEPQQTRDLLNPDDPKQVQMPIRNAIRNLEKQVQQQYRAFKACMDEHGCHVILN